MKYSTIRVITLCTCVCLCRYDGGGGDFSGGEEPIDDFDDAPVSCPHQPRGGGGGGGGNLKS